MSVSIEDFSMLDDDVHDLISECSAILLNTPTGCQRETDLVRLRRNLHEVQARLRACHEAANAWFRHESPT